MAGGNNNDNSDEQPRFPHPPPDDVRYVQQLTDLPATTSGPAEAFIQDLGHPESAERSTLPGAAQFLTAEELSALGHHGPNAPQYGTAQQQHASHALDSQGYQALGHPVSAERSTLPSGTQFLTPEELSALGPHGPNASHYSTAEQHHASHAVDPQGYQSFMEMLGPVPAFGPPQDPFNLQQGVYGAVAQPGGTQYDYQIGQSMVSPGHHTTGSTYPLVTSAGYSQSMQDPTTYAGGLTTFPDFASTTTFQQTSPTLTRGPGLQSDRRATRSASQATSNIYPSGGPSHTQQGAPRQWIVPRPSGGQSGQHRLGYSSQTGGEDVEEFGHGQRLMQVDSATYASNPEDSVKEEPETRKAGGKRKRPLTEGEREHKRLRHNSPSRSNAYLLPEQKERVPPNWTTPPGWILNRYEQIIWDLSAQGRNAAEISRIFDASCWGPDETEATATDTDTPNESTRKGAEKGAKIGRRSDNRVSRDLQMLRKECGYDERGAVFVEQLGPPKRGEGNTAETRKAKWRETDAANLECTGADGYVDPITALRQGKQKKNKPPFVPWMPPPHDWPKERCQKPVGVVVNGIDLKLVREGIDEDMQREAEKRRRTKGQTWRGQRGRQVQQALQPRPLLAEGAQQAPQHQQALRLYQSQQTSPPHQSQPTQQYHQAEQTPQTRQAQQTHHSQPSLELQLQLEAVQRAPDHQQAIQPSQSQQAQQYHYARQTRQAQQAPQHQHSQLLLEFPPAQHVHQAPQFQQAPQVHQAQQQHPQDQRLQLARELRELEARRLMPPPPRPPPGGPHRRYSLPVEEHQLAHHSLHHDRSEQNLHSFGRGFHQRGAQSRTDLSSVAEDETTDWPSKMSPEEWNREMSAMGDELLKQGRRSSRATAQQSSSVTAPAFRPQAGAPHDPMLTEVSPSTALFSIHLGTSDSWPAFEPSDPNNRLPRALASVPPMHNPQTTILDPSYTFPQPAPPAPPPDSTLHHQPPPAEPESIPLFMPDPQVPHRRALFLHDPSAPPFQPPSTATGPPQDLISPEDLLLPQGQAPAPAPQHMQYAVGGQLQSGGARTRMMAPAGTSGGDGGGGVARHGGAAALQGAGRGAGGGAAEVSGGGGSGGVGGGSHGGAGGEGAKGETGEEAIDLTGDTPEGE